MERQIRPWSDHAINTHKKLLSFNFLDIVLLQVSHDLPLACFSFPFRGASQIPITSSGGSKPSDTEGAWSSRPSDKGKARLQKDFISALWASVWSRNKGGWGWPPRAPPLHPPLTSFPNLSISFTSSPLPLLLCLGFCCCCCFSYLRDGVVVPCSTLLL